MNNMFNIGDVQTPCSNVSGNEDRGGVRGESLQALEPLLLMHVGMQAITGHLKQTEKVHKPEKRQKFNLKLLKVIIYQAFTF